ncbi:MAG TPA: tyrosine-type recombinase/integrase [Candidatus Binataceae bacterium]|nr:tyrosine-type recombinase/integrase [Candidatus Binataceae bacterium]
MAETSAKVSRGEYLDHSKVPTFQEAAELWFASKTDRRPSHVADLRSRLDKHILPRVGSLRLDRITVGAIEKLRDGLSEEGYAPRTINTIIRIASAVFRAAIRRGDATNNPIDRVERAFMAARELTPGEDEGRGSDSDAVNFDSILSPDELRSMLDAATPGYYRTLFTTAFITGMRSGELLALRWNDIEFDDGKGRGKVYIRRTLSWARINRGQPVRPRFYPPKTRAGLRAIAIAPELVSVLKTWKLRCPPSDFDLVFPHTDGQPNCRDRVLCVGLYPALRRAGLRRVNFHSVRHSRASALIAAGAPVTEVQHRLGHASPAITLKVYSHWFKGAETGAADRLAEVILGDLSASTGTREKWAKSGHSNSGVATLNAISA